MAKIVMVLGYSGSGKSYSLKNIPEDTYGLISVAGKELPFKSKKQFRDTDDYLKITHMLLNSASDIIVIDDSQYLMSGEFMRRSKEKGYEKYTDIGKNFYDLIKTARSLPDNKTVYFLHHLEQSEDGREKEKTIGKLLDDKIVVVGLFSIVIKAVKVDNKYLFRTQSTGFDPVKTPAGMFATEEIDNDLLIVDNAIRAYYELPAAQHVQVKAKKDDDNQ